MAGAVHGLEAHGPALDVGEVHVLAVDVPVARRLEEFDVEEDRRLDLAVAAGGVLLAPELGQRVPDDHAVGQPERRAGRELGEEEQAELATEPAVVAGAGLLEALEVLGELGLLEERRAVDAGEHRAGGVAAPVGAGDGLQLERADRRCRGRVRSTAEVGERPVAVQAHGLDALGANEVLDELDLVGLVLGAEALDRLLDRHVLALERLRRGDVLAHPRLDALEVGVTDSNAVGEVEVVVEALLDRRPDRDLHAGIELEHGGGEHVGRVVADEVERVLPAAGGDDLERLVRLQRAREIAHVAVLADGERGAGEPRTDRRRGVGARGALGQVERRAVGKRDVHLPDGIRTNRRSSDPATVAGFVQDRRRPERPWRAA